MTAPARPDVIDGPLLVAGLGNPGREYERTRHNVGAMVVAELAGRGGDRLSTHKARAHVATTRLGTGPGGVPGPKAILAVPMSYMNESGGPVKGLLSFYSLTPGALVVVHDDIDVPFGQIKLKVGGGEGGHNGLRSISSSTGTRDYLRVRVGVGRPPGRMDAADFVLREFSAAERKELPLLISDAADAVEMLASEGLTAAQQRFHRP